MKVVWRGIYLKTRSLARIQLREDFWDCSGRRGGFKKWWQRNQTRSFSEKKRTRAKPPSEDTEDYPISQVRKCLLCRKVKISGRKGDIDRQHLRLHDLFASRAFIVIYQKRSMIYFHRTFHLLSPKQRLLRWKRKHCFFVICAIGNKRSGILCVCANLTPPCLFCRPPNPKYAEYRSSQS